MSPSSAAIHPRLIVVTGRPGAGKTTLTDVLAREMGCMKVWRDEIKEEILRSPQREPSSDREVNLLVNDLFFDAVHAQLVRGVTVVAEAAFQHKLWEPRLVPLLSIARTRIIVCEISAELARSRRIARAGADPQRESFHPDDVVRAAREGRMQPVGEYDPPHFAVPTLSVNTSDGYLPSLQDIITFARA